MEKEYKIICFPGEVLFHIGTMKMTICYMKEEGLKSTCYGRMVTFRENA